MVGERDAPSEALGERMNHEGRDLLVLTVWTPSPMGTRTMTSPLLEIYALFSGKEQ